MGILFWNVRAEAQENPLRAGEKVWPLSRHQCTLNPASRQESGLFKIEELQYPLNIAMSCNVFCFQTYLHWHTSVSRGEKILPFLFCLPFVNNIKVILCSSIYSGLWMSFLPKPKSSILIIMKWDDTPLLTFFRSWSLHWAIICNQNWRLSN